MRFFASLLVCLSVCITASAANWNCTGNVCTLAAPTVVYVTQAEADARNSRDPASTVAYQQTTIPQFTYYAENIEQKANGEMQGLYRSGIYNQGVPFAAPVMLNGYEVSYNARCAPSDAIREEVSAKYAQLSDTEKGYFKTRWSAWENLVVIGEAPDSVATYPVANADSVEFWAEVKNPSNTVQMVTLTWDIHTEWLYGTSREETTVALAPNTITRVRGIRTYQTKDTTENTLRLSFDPFNHRPGDLPPREMVKTKQSVGIVIGIRFSLQGEVAPGTYRESNCPNPYIEPVKITTQATATWGCSDGRCWSTKSNVTETNLFSNW